MSALGGAVKSAFCLAAVFSFAAISAGDEVTLKDGRVIEGDVTEDDGKVLKIRLRKGTVTLDRADVVSVVEKPTPEQEYEERLSRLAAGDAAAQLEFALWAGSHGFEDEAVRHLLEAHRLDPALERAEAELKKRDYHLVEGVWKDAETYYPSIGWYKLDGRWYHPVEHAWRVLLREVDRLEKVRDTTIATLRSLRAARGRLTTLVAAERAQVEAYPRRIAEADAELKAAGARYAAAQARRDSASQAVDKGEVDFENSREGEGGTLEALGRIRQLRRNHRAAKAAVAKAEKELAAAEKRALSLVEEASAAQMRLDRLEIDLQAADARALAFEEQVPRDEAAVKAAGKRAELAREEWVKVK